MLIGSVTWDKSYSFKTKEASGEADTKLSRTNFEFVSVSWFLLACWIGFRLVLGEGSRGWGGCNLWGFVLIRDTAVMLWLRRP